MMTHFAQAGSLAISAFLLLTACSSNSFQTFDKAGQGAYEASGPWPDALSIVCTPGQDAEGDGIPDEVEGCAGEDLDGDGIPNFIDSDSDGDGIIDSIEAGHGSEPVDSDGDGDPDYLDADSDDDGVADGDEDLNGDGAFGCCRERCGEFVEGCPEVVADGCGAGQRCEGGSCIPALDFLCSDGETSPFHKATFDDGLQDDQRPTFICGPQAEIGDRGLKKMQFQRSSKGDWHLALELGARYAEVTIPSPQAREAAALIDLPAAEDQVAGFIVSLPVPAPDLNQLSALVMGRLTQIAGATQTLFLNTGSEEQSHDGFPTMVGIHLRVVTNPQMSVSQLRDALVPLALDRPAGELNISGQPYGGLTTMFLLRVQTLLRSDGRLIVVGAVAEEARAHDANLATGTRIEDLINGTGLATAVDSATVECDPFEVVTTPKADIIWVVDESGTMDDDRQNVAANAKNFFARAIASGLDFRMAVTNVVNPEGVGGAEAVGRFCAAEYAFDAKGELVNEADAMDEGGEDRFLLPTEQHLFESCVRNPPGYEGVDEWGMVNAFQAVKKHLPRQDNNPKRVRKDATLVIIAVTDEIDQGYLAADPWFGTFDMFKCTLDAARIQWVTDVVYKEHVALYTGVSDGGEGKAVMHLIGGLCGNLCGADITHGYKQVAQKLGGTSADVCQPDLSTSLQLMIDSIVGAASPLKLEYLPISASLAVAKGAVALTRGRQDGFDYNRSSNTVVLFGVPIKKGDQLVASYRRWVKQRPGIQ
ncbi:MAG: hypothetical protein JRH20_16590 [Deltaproteobacteria bacterium]|nr:hypothetical protein [Deltaproteobacteria bacterium]